MVNLSSLLKARRSSPVLSVVLNSVNCDWLLANAQFNKRVSCTQILASGRVPTNQKLFNDSGLVTEHGLSALLSAVLESIEDHHKTPKFLVVSVPYIHSFQSELTVPRGQSDSEIRFQIEEMLLDLAGQGDENTIFDWQEKNESAAEPDHQTLVVSTIREDQLELISEVAKECGMKCVGLTLDSLACANGYCQASQRLVEQPPERYLLVGCLSEEMVRLTIFVDGALFSESMANQLQEFSLVQAISALEKLVVSWIRGIPDATPENVVLILTGNLSEQRSSFQAASRSQQIGPFLVEIKAPTGLESNWHEAVTAYGALEGLPCG